MKRRYDMITINIANDFSKTPGGRYIEEGPYSGEEFRIEMLKPKYLEAVDKKEKLCINMDGCLGFAPSFLDESFGALSRELNEDILNNIDIISEDEEDIIERIRKVTK